MILHGFAGHVLKSMFPMKEVMYTRPIGRMDSIMKQTLEKTAFDETNLGVLKRFSLSENYQLLDGGSIEISPLSTYLILFEGGAEGVALKLSALSNYWETRQQEC